MGKWKIEWAYRNGTVASLVATSVEDNIIAVAFRATYSSGGITAIVTDDDWHHDFSFFQNGCMDGLLAGCEEGHTVHNGFLAEYVVNRDAIRKVVLDLVKKNQYKDCGSTRFNSRILFTGFSQGAGIAPVAVFDIGNYLKSQKVD